MAAVPAYRIDRVSAARPMPRQSAPAVRVVPGRKHSVNPPVSNLVVLGIRVLIVALIAVFLMGFARVTLASMAYSTASEASSLRTQISDARTTGESLAIQQSLLASSGTLEAQAEEELGMVEATAEETLVLSADPVAIDAEGNLSFAGSVARLAAQG